MLREIVHRTNRTAENQSKIAIATKLREEPYLILVPIRFIQEAMVPVRVQTGKRVPVDRV